MNRKLVLMLTLTLLVGMLSVVFSVQRVEASGTIYIRADGSIGPTSAPVSTVDNLTYTLMGDITSDAYADGMVVERDNIVIDGAGYTLQATEVWGKGINLFLRSNVTIQNMTIKAFLYGIYLDNSISNIIVGNNITNNEYGGIWLYSSSDSSIIRNNIDHNDDYGIYLESSSNNSIVGNVFANDGLAVWYSYGNVVEDNFVNGKPLVCFKGLSGAKIENAGQVIVIDCDNITVENLNLSHTSIGIELWNTTNTKITGNNVANNWHGIWLCYSSNNSVVGNNVTANNDEGIYLSDSSKNVIYHNNFINNAQQTVIGTPGYANVWDYGYNSGGNFWSDYNGTDADSNGIGDTQYLIDANNTDNYPLMTQYIIPEFPSFLILPLFFIATLLAVIIHKKKNEGKGKKAISDWPRVLKLSRVLTVPFHSWKGYHTRQPTRRGTMDRNAPNIAGKSGFAMLCAVTNRQTFLFLPINLRIVYSGGIMRGKCLNYSIRKQVTQEVT